MDWLHTAPQATKHSPPSDFRWTSHSLRKGAALATNAIEAPLNDIRYAGGWSTNSSVLEAKYIDFAMAPSYAAYIFFGHLKRDTPTAREDEQQMPQPCSPGIGAARRECIDTKRKTTRRQRRQSRSNPQERFIDIFSTLCRG